MDYPSSSDQEVVVFDDNKDSAEYNKLFGILVSGDAGEDTLVGYVAYVFYKIAKREWVEEFYESNKRHPNDGEMRSYISSWTPSMVDSVRSEANQALSAYASYVVDKAAPAITQQALSHKSFIREALVAFCGAFIYTLVAILFAVVLHFIGIDLVEAQRHLSLENGAASSPSTAAIPVH